MIKILKNSNLTVKIATHGAELSSALASDGFEFIRQKDDRWANSSPILFPVCGRLKNNEYRLGGKRYDLTPHGFILHSDFEVLSEASDSVTLVFHSNEQSRRVYPFDLTVTVEYTLVGKTLKSSYTVKNNSSAPMPFMIGLHPAFKLPLGEGIKTNEHKIDFGRKRLTYHPLCNGCFVSKKSEEWDIPDGVYTINEEAIYENDTLVFANAPSKVRLYADGTTREVKMEYSPEFSYFCIWKRADKDDKYLCLEPWTSVPTEGLLDECFDGREDMFSLSPNSEMSFFCNITFEF
ncbi:MAG: hypothetical protein IJY65_04325 [Clostridia bacterium]|nr:hypothetical protein [Clostridia bacterium]